jgi:hypothetical protein
VARVVAFVPDLLFGSNVVGALQAGGHEPVLVGAAQDVAGAASDADVLVVDLTADVDERLEVVRPLLGGDVRSLAFFSHVETDVREQAAAAGFDLVVPRSRMARAGADLVTQLAG